MHCMGLEVVFKLFHTSLSLGIVTNLIVALIEKDLIIGNQAGQVIDATT